MNYLEEAKDIRDELRFQGNSWNRQRIIQKAQKLKLKIEAEGIGCDEWTGTTEDGSMYGKTNYCDEMQVLCSKCSSKQEAIKILDEVLNGN